MKKNIIKRLQDNSVVVACSLFMTFYGVGDLTYDIYKTIPTSIVSEFWESDTKYIVQQDIVPKYNNPTPQVYEIPSTRAILSSTATLEFSKLKFPESSWAV